MLDRIVHRLIRFSQYGLYGVCRSCEEIFINLIKTSISTILVLQRVGGFLVNILGFPVRNLAETDVLPADVDILVQVAGAEVHDVHRVVGDVLRTEVWRGRLVVDLTGVSAVVVLSGPVGQVGLHHGQPSPGVINISH